MRDLVGRRASFAIEQVALLAIVAAALAGTAVYAMRALCGKWRDVGDVFGHGRQYERCVTQQIVCDTNGCGPRPEPGC